MAPNEQRPFFIFGCPRSGTSVLTRMLGAHPRLGIPYESHLYNRIYPLAQRYGDLADPRARERFLVEILRTDYIRQWTPPPSLADTLAAIQRYDFHGIVDALMGAWAAGQGKSRWGEKTPQHTLCWRNILAGFPNLQVIHLVRDGRDVALSYKAVHFGPKHVYHLAERWITYLVAAEEARKVLGDGAYLTVRYEDLVAEPERALRRICDFLGEEFSPAMLAFYRGEVAYPTDPRNEDNLRRPLMSGNSGKWHTGMTSREVRIFESLAGAWLERYGYERALGDPRLPFWERLSCRFLEHPARRAYAMLQNRQGQRLTLETLRLRLRLMLGLWGA